MSVVRTSLSLPQNLFDYLSEVIKNKKVPLSSYISDLIEKEKRAEELKKIQDQYNALSEEDINEDNNFIQACSINYINNVITDDNK